jgi:hypothetical protein
MARKRYFRTPQEIIKKRLSRTLIFSWLAPRAVLRDPGKNFRFHKPQIGLDADVGYEPPLHIAVDRFHVDADQLLNLARREKFFSVARRPLRGSRSNFERCNGREYLLGRHDLPRAVF